MKKDSYTLDELVDRQVNSIFKKGTLFSSLMGFFSSFTLLYLQSIGVLKDFTIPIIWTTIGGIVSILVYLLAKKGKIKGRISWYVSFLLASLPSVLFLLAHFLLPSGAATFLTGPASYLYFFFIAISGFTFQSNLAIAIGVYCSLQYSFFVVLDFKNLLQIVSEDKLLLQDLTAAPIYHFKSMMMFVSALVVSVIAKNTRELIFEMVEREKEKQSISRLFGQFVSSEVKDKILLDRSYLTGETKDVAILFSDIRDYTAFSERHEPKEVVEQLNEYLDSMVECITTNGGTVDKFIGDAIMAVFGGVIPLDSPSNSAVQAAFSMKIKLEKLNAKRAKKGLTPFKNGIGIHFGQVLQGAIGSEERKDFTVIGDTVNTASRLEGLSKNHNSNIIISESVYNSLGENQEKFQFIDKVKVKGKENEILIYGIV